MNVDFSRNRSHSSLRFELCGQSLLFPAINILSGGLFDTAVTKRVSMHEVDNTSDHEPLLLDITVSHQRLALTSRRYRARPAWFKANTVDIDNCRANLIDNLRAVDLPYAVVLCKNVLCCDNGHRQAMNKFAIEITQACLLAAGCSISSTGRSDTRSKKVPGWTELVEPHRVKSLFWHDLLIDCVGQSQVLSLI